MSKARIVGLGFGVLMILAAFGLVLWQTANTPVTGTAFAQGAATATPSASGTTTPPQQTPPQQPQQGQQQQQSQIGDSFWALLATKLGVTVDDLTTKAVQARQEMIDQAVKDGRITQEQADAIKQRITSNDMIAPIPLGRAFGPGYYGNGQGGNGNRPGGNLPQRVPGQLPGGFGGPGPVIGPGFGGFGRGFGSNLQELTAIATAVKLEPKALIEQLSQGKTLADVAKAQNVDETTVKQAIIDFRKAQIDQQLALGLISEVQANQLKARLTVDSIDLSRGYRFNMETTPGQQQQSQTMPGMPGGQFVMPSQPATGGDVQTQ